MQCYVCALYALKHKLGDVEEGGGRMINEQKKIFWKINDFLRQGGGYKSVDN